MAINPNDIEIILYNPAYDDLSNLNFLQSDGSDPLHVHEFYIKYILGNCKSDDNIYAIKFKNNFVGFFSTAFVDFDSTGSKSDVKHKKENTSIPCLQITNMGIDQKSRCYGIGKYILLYTLGLAQKINKLTPCKILIFRTTITLAEKIYSPKYQFRYAKVQKKLVWTYRKIC